MANTERKNLVSEIFSLQSDSDKVRENKGKKLNEFVDSLSSKEQDIERDSGNDS